MKNLLLATTASIAIATVAGAATFSEVDIDDDGALTEIELVAIFGTEQAAAILARADKNGDGVLRISELDDDDEDDDDEDDDDDDDRDDDEDDNGRDDDDEDEDHDDEDDDDEDEDDDEDADDGDEDDDDDD